MTTTTPKFQLHYRKHKYTPDRIDSVLLYDIQNYIPIYNRFFDINETNYNGIQLNQKYYLQNIIEHPRDATDETHSTSLNHLETIIGDDAGNTTNVPIFVKYSPLLDPIRYLSGKYETPATTTTADGNSTTPKTSLPKYNSTPETCEEKMLNTNNSSYVDGLFSCCSSFWRKFSWRKCPRLPSRLRRTISCLMIRASPPATSASTVSRYSSSPI